MLFAEISNSPRVIFFCPKKLVFTFAGHTEPRVLELEIS